MASNEKFFPIKINTWVVLIFLLACVVYCFMGDNIRRWENTSLFVTLVYTIVLYIRYFQYKDKFSSFLLGTCITTCVALAFIFVGTIFHLIGLFLPNLAVGRIEKMWGLFLGSMVFILLNVAMYRSVKELACIKNSLIYSDGPGCASFLTLAFYASYIRIDSMAPSDKEIWDGFFAGAVAFQMLSSNIIWALNDDNLFESQTGYPKFSEGDLVDLPNLAKKLKEPDRAFDIWINNELSDRTKDALEEYKEATSDPKCLQQHLLEDLNNIISGDSIFVDSRFDGITLRPETNSLALKNPPDSNSELLNRMLFEDAYAHEISKNRTT